MLTEDEKREIEEQLTHYPEKQAVCIEALKIVQRKRRWISDESIRDIADILEMTPDEVDNVASFYNLIYRKPVGKHVIHFCDSVSCWIMGYERLLERFSSRLNIKPGETSNDGSFTRLPIVCLGTCDHAPAIMIDNELYGNLDPEDIDEILDKYK
jgi:NADH-quinone oxidoreductase subunit E